MKCGETTRLVSRGSSIIEFGNGFKIFFELKLLFFLELESETYSNYFQTSEYRRSKEGV